MKYNVTREDIKGQGTKKQLKVFRRHNKIARRLYKRFEIILQNPKEEKERKGEGGRGPTAKQLGKDRREKRSAKIKRSTETIRINLRQTQRKFLRKEGSSAERGVRQKQK